MSNLPANRTVHPRRLPPRRGLSLVEVLISLTICATLLTAIGAGFVATSNAMQANDEFARATQATRVCLLQMENEIRSGWIDPYVTVDANGVATQVRLITSSRSDRTYKYDAANKQLLLITNSTATDPDYVLARNVSSAKFAILKGTDALGNVCISEIGITITVKVGKNQVTLSGSAAPRMNLQR